MNHSYGFGPNYVYCVGKKIVASFPLFESVYRYRHRRQMCCEVALNFGNLIPLAFYYEIACKYTGMPRYSAFYNIAFTIVNNLA